jgi:hypothetical protein
MAKELTIERSLKIPKQLDMWEKRRRDPKYEVSTLVRQA